MEEARLEFKSYVVNQGQFDSMRGDYCQRLRRAIAKQNGYVEQEELISEEEKRMKFRKGNQNWGREDGRKTEANVGRRGVDHTEERRRRNSADTPPPTAFDTRKWHRGIKLKRGRREGRESERSDSHSSTG